MHTRYMERVNSMRGKRPLEGEDEQQQPERKRPALASVIVEALKLDSLQKLCSSLEPILRRVVSEEVERALAKLAPPRLSGRSSPRQIEGPDGRSLQLHFKSRLSLPLFTGGKVEGEQGAAIHFVLLDANAGQVVTYGPESNLKLEVVVLEGDFNNENDEDWRQEEFESHVVKERDGKRPLLTGDLQVSLKEGVGSLGELSFTDNSSWIRSRKFRLGLRVSSGYAEGIRIREAKTEAFTVKDHRGELYKKHYPPALNDDVWRLEKIGKDGSFHKRLNQAGIFTVEDFLRLVVRDPPKLRSTLGSGMSNKMWDALIEHAKTCVLSGRLYVYYPDDTRNVGVVFNNIYELSGLINGEQYFPVHSLPEAQKMGVDTLVKKAYENWNQVIEYDGESLLGYAQPKKSSASRNQLLPGPVDYPNSFDNQLSTPSSASVHSEQSAGDSSLPLGYNESMANKFPGPPHFLDSEPRVHYNGNMFSSQEHQINNSQQTQNGTRYGNNNVGLALGPPQPSSSSFQGMNNASSAAAAEQQYANNNPYDDWSQSRGKGVVEEFMSEDEIRMRSHEMLENDEMQHFLRLFSMGGSNINIPSDDGFGFPNYMSAPTPNMNFGFDEDSSRPGKSVAGWLKIKAAMRWGFFIRKKAAERRRAQLVELDDD
ncbi:calmodulin-binding protein 60 D-like [Impatiens glandulifera]|uniref:calmodulin-binding protein 60 D-like n=1 Tax=Impatiens glandulifera TaxID=253017 RepID=UPI001FB06753|nr:calmodulin-binding protein 60 D-like [Impatiens glandulifera]XP_047319940.1 calmodulin-binding protein 60 D-like [Impatiens glandulifera]XP_047319941.1 calmodulin-binding protein 60 D-like [Impatiens glandulifera]